MDCEDNKREYLMELLTAFRYINITILYGLELCGSWEKFKFVDMRKENTLLKSQEKITFVVLKTNIVFFSIVWPVVVFFSIWLAVFKLEVLDAAPFVQNIWKKHMRSKEYN